MTKNYKLIGWYVLIALLAWCMWGAGTSLQFNAVTGLNINFSVTALFLVLTSLTVLGYVMFRQWFVWVGASALVGLSFLAWFGFTLLNLLGVAILLVLNWDAYRRTGHEVTERTKIRSAQFLWKGLYPVVLGIFLMASFALYQSSFADELKKSSELPSQTKVFFEQLANKFLTPQLDLATPKERQSVVSQVASDAYQQANAWLKPYFRYAPPVVAFGLFLILWGLSWIFVGLAMLVGMLLFWLLKKTRMVRIEEKDVKAETIVV